MNMPNNISAEDAEAMHKANIDVALSVQILETLNKGDLSSSGAAAASNSTACSDFEIPVIDGKNIVDFSAGLSYSLSKAQIQKLLQEYPELQASSMARRANTNGNHTKLELNEAEIAEVGQLLSPYFAFGVLNGGSASSYFDSKKNQGFSPELYSLFEQEFDSLASDFAHLPKALCPAFLIDDKSNDKTRSKTVNQNYGPSFMGLKLRSLLHCIQGQRELRRQLGLPQATQQSKFFQMTSELTHKPLQDYIDQTVAGKGWQDDPAALGPLVAELGWQPSEQIFSEKQPLIATFDQKLGTNSQTSGDKWQFFCDKAGKYLPMPGGHGQCFFALQERLRKLYQQGMRYISLGNIDNIAYNPQPGFIGLLALSGRESFFVCSYRSSVDTKGGVLLQPKKGASKQLNCFDIGVGVDKDILTVAEQEGKDLLFNCAIGYFKLESLLAKLDTIIAGLPLRISEQNKDRGHYWQVEQVTWEVIGLLDSVLIGAVRKEDHFLAAKLQLESFVNTAYRLEDYQSAELTKLAELARCFSAGYAKVLKRDCDYNFAAG